MATAVIVALASVTLWIFQHDIAAHLAADNERKMRYANVSAGYELTQEDKDVLMKYPDSTIAGCYNDVKEGLNKQKCEAFISYLRDRCDQYSNSLPYCRNAKSFLDMFLIENN